MPTLADYGWDEDWAARFAEVAPPGAGPGRVLRHDSSELLVAEPGGVRHLPMAPGVPLAVGDWVVVVDGAVSGPLPRSSLLRRGDASGDREQLLAANLDLLVVVAGLDRPVKAGRLQRAVTLAWDAGAVPLVVLTKSDLADDPSAACATARAAIPGVEVMAVSVATHDGVEQLHGAIAGRTVVLLGESGAGKSTLANAIVGAQVTTTGVVRVGDNKGRHTTTFRQLHLLPGGGALIDTPGIRGVALWVDPAAVDATFADLGDLAGACRFGDCRHDREPGCALQAAIAKGSVDRTRLDAWNQMHREVAGAALRADEHARRQAGGRSPRISKDGQRRKGRR